MVAEEKAKSFFNGKLNPQQPNSIESCKAKLFARETIQFMSFQLQSGVFSTTTIQKQICLTLDGDFTINAFEKTPDQ